MGYKFYNISVLVVEDNEPMLEITKSLLATFGIGHIYGEKNGKDGFEAFKMINPDIVIADWMMKPMDGISLTRLIRNDPSSPNKFIPIILMTGFSEKRRVIQARDAGVTEFLVKPFNARELYKRIVQVIERPRQFVRAPDFFGPDRRRGKGPTAAPYDGQFRRESDLTNPQIIKLIKEREKIAHEKLAKIRAETGLGKGDKFDLAFQDAPDEE